MISNSRTIYIVIILFLYTICPAFTQPYFKIHNHAIVVDGHNDILTQLVDSAYCFDRDLTGKTQSDLNRFKKAGIDVQIFSIWCDGTMNDPFSYANRQIDTLYSWIRHNPAKMMLVKSPADVEEAVKHHKLGAMIGVEGGHMIENIMDNLDSLFSRGMRYMTLTWNNSNPWATSAMEETYDSLLHQPKGLSDYGKNIIRHMNELGILVDVSHTGEQTFRDVMNTTNKPVIASHSCAYHLCHHFRNLKDDQILAIGKNNGLIMVSFVPNFLDSMVDARQRDFDRQHKAEEDSLHGIYPDDEQYDRLMFSKYRTEPEKINHVSIERVIDHIDYIVNMIGVDHVGLGSDFDGMGDISIGLDGNGIMDFPLVTQALVRRGYSLQDVYKILGGNFIRVFKDNSN
jgi:membrane dipeptidase